MGFYPTHHKPESLKAFHEPMNPKNIKLILLRVLFILNFEMKLGTEKKKNDLGNQKWLFKMNLINAGRARKKRAFEA